MISAFHSSRDSPNQQHIIIGARGKILTLIKVILLALVSARPRGLRVTAGLVATAELRGETGEFVHGDYVVIGVQLFRV